MGVGGYVITSLWKNTSHITELFQSLFRIQETDLQIQVGITFSPSLASGPGFLKPLWVQKPQGQPRVQLSCPCLGRCSREGLRGMGRDSGRCLPGGLSSGWGRGKRAQGTWQSASLSVDTRLGGAQGARSLLDGGEVPWERLKPQGSAAVGAQCVLFLEEKEEKKKEKNFCRTGRGSWKDRDLGLFGEGLLPQYV